MLTATNPNGATAEEVCFRGWQVLLTRFEHKKAIKLFVLPGSLLPSIADKPKEAVEVPILLQMQRYVKLCYIYTEVSHFLVQNFFVDKAKYLNAGH